MADIQLTKPAANQTQTVTSASDARFVLNFSTSDAKLSKSENGENLVMTFDDGAKIEVEGFYTTFNKDSLPTLSVGGADITGEQLAAVLGEDLMPAAGPGAGRTAMPAGGRFRSFADADLNGGLDRLGGLDIGFTDGVQLDESPDNWYKINGDPEVYGLDVEGGALTLVEEGVYVGGNDYFAGISEVRGRINAIDPEGKPLTFTFEDGSNAITTAYGVITLDKTTGEVVYRLDNSDPDTNTLAQGQVASQEFTVIVSDPDGGSTTTRFFVNIRGTNDRPELELSKTSMVFKEDEGPTTDTGTATSTDVDNGHMLGYSATLIGAVRYTKGVKDADEKQPDLAQAENYGKLTFEGTSPNGDTSDFRYTVNTEEPKAENPVQQLGQGESVELTYAVRVQDEHGAWDTREVTVTINGTDDKTKVSVPSVVLKAEGVYDADETTELKPGSRSNPHNFSRGMEHTTEGKAAENATDGIHGMHMERGGGTITISDVDANDHFVCSLAINNAGLPADVTLREGGNEVTILWKGFEIAKVELTNGADDRNADYKVTLLPGAKNLPEGLPIDLADNIKVEVKVTHPDGSTSDADPTPLPITIHGSNDAPTLEFKSGGSHTLKEDGSAAQRQVSGDVLGSDVDGDMVRVYLLQADGTPKEDNKLPYDSIDGEGLYLIIRDPDDMWKGPDQTEPEGWGRLTLDGDHYTFTLNNGNPRVQALNEGETLHLVLKTDDGSPYYTFVPTSEFESTYGGKYPEKMFRVYDTHDAYADLPLELRIQGTNDEFATSITGVVVKEKGWWGNTDTELFNPKFIQETKFKESGDLGEGDYRDVAHGSFTLTDTADDNAFVGENPVTFNNGTTTLDVYADMLVFEGGSRVEDLSLVQMRAYGFVDEHDNYVKVGTLVIGEDGQIVGNNSVTVNYTFTLDNDAVNKLPQGTTLNADIKINVQETGKTEPTPHTLEKLVQIKGSNDRTSLTLNETQLVVTEDTKTSDTITATGTDEDYNGASGLKYFMVDASGSEAKQATSIEVWYTNNEGVPGIVGRLTVGAGPRASSPIKFEISNKEGEGHTHIDELGVDENGFPQHLYLFIDKDNGRYVLRELKDGETSESAVKVTVRTYDVGQISAEEHFSLVLRGADDAPVIDIATASDLEVTECGYEDGGNKPVDDKLVDTGSITARDPEGHAFTFRIPEEGNPYIRARDDGDFDVLIGDNDFGIAPTRVIGTLKLENSDDGLSATYTFTLNDDLKADRDFWDGIDEMPGGDLEIPVTLEARQNGEGDTPKNSHTIRIKLNGANDKPTLTVGGDGDHQEGGLHVYEYGQKPGVEPDVKYNTDFFTVQDVADADMHKLHKSLSEFKNQGTEGDTPAKDLLTFSFTNTPRGAEDGHGNANIGKATPDGFTTCWIVRVDLTDATKGYTLKDTEPKDPTDPWFLLKEGAPLGKLEMSNAQWTKGWEKNTDGSFSIKGIDEAGKYTFTLNSNHPDVQALRKDDHPLDIPINIMVQDEHGAFDIREIALHIHGADVPSLTPPSSATFGWKSSVSEVLTEQGVVFNTNTDNKAAQTTGWKSLDADYPTGKSYTYTVKFGEEEKTVNAGEGLQFPTDRGTMFFRIEGNQLQYKYDVDNTRLDDEGIQHFSVAKSGKGDWFGQFAVTATTDGTDESATMALNVRVQGANDRPTLDLVPTESKTTVTVSDAKATGKFTRNDVDDDNNTLGFDIVPLGTRLTDTNVDGRSTFVGEYGLLTVGRDGSYTYELTEGTAKYNDLKKLDPGKEVTDTFCVRVFDTHGAWSTQELAFTIGGGVTLNFTEDGEKNFSTDADENRRGYWPGGEEQVFSESGKVVLDGVPTKFTADDATITYSVGKQGTLSTLTVDDAGNYTVTLNNTSDDVQKLWADPKNGVRDKVGPEQVSVKVVMKAADGGVYEKTVDIFVNVEGSNDAPYFVKVSTDGSLGDPVGDGAPLTRDIDVNSPDITNDPYAACVYRLGSAEDVDKDSAGKLHYFLPQLDTAGKIVLEDGVPQLPVGDSEDDDKNKQFEMGENGLLQPGDGHDYSAYYATQQYYQGEYGYFRWTDNGNVEYVLNKAKAAGGTLDGATDTVYLFVQDQYGATDWVPFTVTIKGTSSGGGGLPSLLVVNLSSDGQQIVAWEDNGDKKANTTDDGKLVYSGGLFGEGTSIPAGHYFTLGADNMEAFGDKYGLLELNSTTGAWRYTLNNNHPDVQALNVGETLTRVFDVYHNGVPFEVGGKPVQLTLEIHGTNDLATAGDTKTIIQPDDPTTGPFSVLTKDTDGRPKMKSLADDGGDGHTVKGEVTAVDRADGRDAGEDPGAYGYTYSYVGPLAPSNTFKGAEEVTLTLQDKDGKAPKPSADGSYCTLEGTYGILTFYTQDTDGHKKGEYAYTVYKSLADQDYEDPPLKDTFTVKMVDGTGDLDMRDITINIRGTTKFKTAFEVTEDAVDGEGNPLPLVQDSSETYTGWHFKVGENADAKDAKSFIQTDYGMLRVHADGSYTFTLDNNSKAVQALGEDESNKSKDLDFTLFATYKEADGSFGPVFKQPIKVTIHGKNDEPTLDLGKGDDPNFASDARLVIKESDDSVSGRAKGEDIDGDALQYRFVLDDVEHPGPLYVHVDAEGTFSLNAMEAEPVGTLTIDASTGEYTLSWIKNGDKLPEAVEKLTSADMKEMTVGVRVTDGVATTTQTLHIVVQGEGGETAPPLTSITGFVNDLPSPLAELQENGVDAFGNPVGVDKREGKLTEYIRYMENGKLNGDATQSLRFALAGSYDGKASGEYGDLVVDAFGNYTYEVDQFKANGLDAGEVKYDTFRLLVLESDGKRHVHEIKFEVKGSNDQPEIKEWNKVIEMTEDDPSQIEGGFLMASGSVAKVIDPEGHAVTYGIKVDGGDWVYITGDAPATIPNVGLYNGTLTIDKDGNYTYAVPSDNKNLQELGLNDEPATLDFYVGVKETTTSSALASEGAKVTVQINGSNDDPEIKGYSLPDGYTLDEDKAVRGDVQSVKGSISAKDMDVNDTLTFRVYKQPEFGTVEVNKNTGVFTYTLNSDGGVPGGDNVPDRFWIVANDGHKDSVPYEVTVSLHGSNQAPTVTSWTNKVLTVDEPDVAVPDERFVSATGSIVAKDIDPGDNDKLIYEVIGNSFVKLTADRMGLALSDTDKGSVGQLVINDRTGEYEFKLQANAIDHWDDTNTAELTFLVDVKDPTEEYAGGTDHYAVKVIVKGHNDAPVDVSLKSVSETETDSKGDVDGQYSQISGFIDAHDPEGSTLTYFFTGTGKYGTLELNKTTGEYTYTTNKTAIDEIGNGDFKTDTFYVKAFDGKKYSEPYTLEIKVTGNVNHAPTLAAVQTLTVTMPDWGTIPSPEDGKLVSGDIDKGDTDNHVFDLVNSGAGRYGTLELDDTATENYTYTLNKLDVDSNGDLSPEIMAQMHSMANGGVKDTFDIKVTDEGGLHATGQLEVTVKMDNKIFDAKDYTGKVGGSTGDDFLLGTDGADELHGGKGDDVLFGNAGDDVLYGGLGNDTLYGGSGNDFLQGGSGADALYGGSGNDLIIYDGSDVFIDGGAGMDLLVGMVGMGGDSAVNALLAGRTNVEGSTIQGIQVAIDTTVKFGVSMDDLLDSLKIGIIGEKVSLNEADGWKSVDTAPGGNGDYVKYTHINSNDVEDATLVVLKSALETNQGG